MQDLTSVILYTDGACSGNPGPGGYGTIMLSGQHRKELSGGFRKTTNNRMELYAVIIGLEALKRPCNVVVWSDSSYVCNAMEKGWAKKWRENDWKRNKKDKAENPDLWERLLNLCEDHTVTFQWLRGHAGHPENERADRLAVLASSGTNLPADYWYESSS